MFTEHVYVVVQKLPLVQIFQTSLFFSTSLYFLDWFVYQLSKKGFYLWAVVKKIGAWLF